ncbi:MAG: DEAD/DEAH box helicase [Steroidobacteraceae bacterium]
MADSHLTDLSFTGLHLPETLQKGLADAGFERCTPIQAQTLPHALAGMDVAGQAQTGTGKTVAFLVALYARLLREPVPAERKLNAPRAVILAPTRELAVQIHSDAEPLGQHTGLRLGLAFGGIDFEKQKRHLEEGVDILIGTPGRIIDFYKQHVIDLSAVQVLVLDEADRMFDLGFINDIRYILRRMPAPDKRLNLLFSATLSQRVLELAYEHMNSPQLTRIEPDKMTVERIRQVIYYPSNDEKPRLLVGLLKHMDPTRSMVFVNTRRAAEDVEALLRGNGINAEAISGDVPQPKRMRMMRDFHDGTLAVLIGTDVASRGLHIPDVSHVFNYDLPQDPEDYVHRIGRTARAGTDGDAISLGCEEYVMSLPDIESYIGRKIPVASVTPEMLAELAPAAPRRRREHAPARGRSGGQRGGRPGAGGPRHGGSNQGSSPRREHHQRNEQPRRHHGGEARAEQPQTGNTAAALNQERPVHGGAPQGGRRPPRREGHPQNDPHSRRQAGRHDARRGGGRHDDRHKQQRSPEQQHAPRVVPQQPAPRTGVVARVGRMMKNLFGRFSSKRR